MRVPATFKRLRVKPTDLCRLSPTPHNSVPPFVTALPEVLELFSSPIRQLQFHRSLWQFGLGLSLLLTHGARSCYQQDQNTSSSFWHFTPLKHVFKSRSKWVAVFKKGLFVIILVVAVYFDQVPLACRNNRRAWGHVPERVTSDLRPASG